MSEIKERPILFSAPMVRAILEGRKTVTRRVVQGIDPERLGETMPRAQWQKVNREKPVAFGPAYFCPYGQPGDLLWVRESWWQAGSWEPCYPEDDTGAWCGSRRVTYTADGLPPNEPNRYYPNGLRNGARSAADPHRIWRHRPSIHMPRWASRILLEITAVRIERLQDICEKQAEAEGAPMELLEIDRVRLGARASYRAGFHRLWESINGVGSWGANPWVWVVEFKRVPHETDHA